LAGSIAFPLVVIALLAVTCQAVPITYSGFTITDGKLGSWTFHNANVVLTFKSDTDFVQQLPGSVAGVNVAYVDKGIALVTIVAKGKTVQARLDQGQIFISFDQVNGGVGFGFFTPGLQFPANLNPIYPLAMSDALPQAAVSNGILPDTLLPDAGFAGRGRICLSANPFASCASPTLPIKTDKGDLYLFQPYTVDATPPQGSVLGISLNAGFFLEQTGKGLTRLPASLLTRPVQKTTGGITYNLFLVSDVSIGGQLLHNASIHLSFSSNISQVQRVSTATPAGHINSVGTGRVVVTDGSTTIHATFTPNQLYVFFDPATASGGFGSFSGGDAYPAILQSESQFNLLHGVSDIIRNQVGTYLTYSARTQSLAKVMDLKHEFVMADVVSSCTQFGLYQSCSNPTTPSKLTTDKGDFYVYNSYMEYGASVNWAIFWATR